MVHCILCGTENDAWAEFCAGLGCGADIAGLRDGDPNRAVQIDCEPPGVPARAGDLVEVELTVRNAGSVPDRFVLELRRDIGDRVTVERHGEVGDVLPGELRTWTVRYAVPQDWDPAGTMLGAGGIFAVPDLPSDPAIDVPLRVVSTHDRRVAAIATLTIQAASTPEPGAPRRSRSVAKQARHTQYAAGGAVAAVAVVVALIVGMAAAGSGGGNDDPPPRGAAATSGSGAVTVGGGPPGASSAEPSSTDPSPTDSATAVLTPSATPGRTSRPPTSARPSSSGPGVPPPVPSAPTSGPTFVPPSTPPSSSAPPTSPTSVPTSEEPSATPSSPDPGGSPGPTVTGRPCRPPRTCTAVPTPEP